MHIELTEMLRCPEAHREDFLILSTGEMKGRMVRSGIVGCPVCGKEYIVANGILSFGGATPTDPVSRGPAVDPQALQALLELSGPGGFVILVGSAARHAAGLGALMPGIHFVGINPPAGLGELPILSLVHCARTIPLRQAIARGVVIGADTASEPWLSEGQRVLLNGRRCVIETEQATPPAGLTRLASEHGLWVGERR